MMNEKRIQQTAKIGRLELSGRIVMPPMATYLSTEEGKVTEKLIAYYEQRAKNPHVSLIVTEHCFISLSGRAKPGQLSIASDGDIDGLHQLVDAIHRQDTKVFAQLNYAGDPAEMSSGQIGEVIVAFSDAARRAKTAGYDGIEVHSAHGYLLNRFYSPLTNFRTDEYGGDLNGRLKIHRQVMEAVRREVGPDYPVSVRLGGCDYMENGSTIGDSVSAAGVLERCGADMISVTGGLCRYTLPGRGDPGYFRDMSSAIREAVSVPVLLAGGVKTLADAESLLAAGAADLIGVGRALLADADWEA